LDFQELVEFDSNLADELIENPLDFIDCYKASFINENYEVRIIKSPKSINIPIERIRKENLNHLLSVEGRITSFGEVKPVIISSKFECPSCGTIITVNQNYRDGILKEPIRCSCGRKGGFKVVSEDKYNSCFLQLEDLQEKTDNPHSQRVKAIIFNGLTEPENIKVFSPGNEVRCLGILKEVPIKRGGVKSVFINWIFEIISAELIDKEVDLSTLTEEEKCKINELSKDISEKGFEPIITSFSPDVYGYDEIKAALALQLCNRKNDSKKSSIRNKSNILLIGDPGTSKSVMCDFAVEVTHGSKKAVGGGSSAVGITASVVKEEESLGGYRVEPGAMILAKELLFIDELNNLPEDDKPRLQEGMNQQTISIDKANLHVKMKVTGGIIAAANPKGGHFDLTGKETRESQFNIPTPILNRFDSIFVITDNIDASRDSNIADKMIKRHRGLIKTSYDKDFLRKFFTYIRMQEEPTIDEDTDKLINEVYCFVRVRNQARVKLNARFLESLTRMAISSAKMRQSSKVEEKDVLRCLPILSVTEYKIAEFPKREKILI